MAKLIFRTGQFAGKSIGLPAGRTLVLGRNRDIDLPLPDLKLSRRHCEIGNANGRSFAKDLGSTNGTFVNGERLPAQQPRDLRARDRVVLGDTEIEFEADAEELLITGPGQDISNMATPQPGALPTGLGELLASNGPAPSPAPVPLGSAPISQIPAQMYGGGDPRVAHFQAALQEVLRPLPAEPPPLPGTANAGNRPKFIFCDGCNGSIPLLDLDLGTAKEVEGKMICKDCLQRGVHISVVRPAAHPQQQPQLVTGAVAGMPPPSYRPQPQTTNMDSMLAGLDQDAEMVDTTIKRRGVELRESDVMESMDQFEKTTGAAGGRVGGGAVADHKARPATQTPPTAPLQTAKPAPPPPPPAPSQDEMGEEFEEIG